MVARLRSCLPVSVEMGHGEIAPGRKSLSCSRVTRGHSSVASPTGKCILLDRIGVGFAGSTTTFPKTGFAPFELFPLHYVNWNGTVGERSATSGVTFFSSVHPVCG